MENLIRFITKNSPWFTWLFLAILSIVLLCQTNPYHRSIWFGSANFITANVYDAQSSVTGYFGLRQANVELLERTGILEAENQALRQQLQEYQALDFHQHDSVKHQYRYLIAHVVGNSINQAENYITLDKGAADGVHQDLGVADQNGEPQVASFGDVEGHRGIRFAGVGWERQQVCGFRGPTPQCRL